MRKLSTLWTATLLLVATAASASDPSVWVATVGHTAGVHGTVWRSDLSVLNPCTGSTVVELVLNTEQGRFSDTFEIEGGRQQLFEDVVAQLAPGDLTSSLEIRAPAGVIVSSRTYNQTDGGSFGQSLPGILPADALVENETAVLQQLAENSSFRTNIGVLNMGDEELGVTVRLYDRLGESLGAYPLRVPAGQTVQDNRPYRSRFGRSDIVGGYAHVTLSSGSGAWAYASVIDNRSGDPTTVLPAAVPECRLDIADRLASIENLIVLERSTPSPVHRYFDLYYWQPADHDDPDGNGFFQYMTLLHRDESAPMVLHTMGYANWIGSRSLEPTRLLDGNQLNVEHRFFSNSTPTPRNWDLLTISQAAADHHRIVEAIKPIYEGSWISTGGSKGGMTAVYHRRFYPDDVDGTIPYVAPMSLAAPDERYVDFLATRGDASCRAGIAAMQREALLRRGAMIDMLGDLASSNGLTFARIGGVERAFESAVAETPFTFWQYSGAGHCLGIPDPATASDQIVFDFIARYSSFWYPSDQAMDSFGPYFYQAHTELGFPDLDFSHLDDLLLTDPLNLEEGLPPEGADVTFDAGAMADIARWVASGGRTLLFVYGENDPWTAGAFDLGDAEDSYLFIAAGGTHGAGIEDLSPADQEKVYEVLERWTGISLDLSMARAPEPGPPRGRFEERARN